MSTYQLEIDGSGAESGAARIVKSFDEIKAAANRMEGGVTAAAQKASRSFASMQSAAKPVSQAAIDSLRQLSAVMSKFKAPSDAAVRNTIIFLQGLKSVGTINLGRISQLATLTAAIGGFKGPTAMAGRNTEAVINALRKAGGISFPRGLQSIMSSLASFRGPSAAAARNIQAMLNSLSSFKAPAGLNAATKALIALTNAANTATGAMGRLKSASVGNMKVMVSSGNATRGLAMQHGLLHSAILKTTTLYNSLGSILAARAIINASNDIIKIRAQLEAATGSVQQSRVQFEFLRQQTERLGLEFQSTARSYGFFLGSIKGTGVTFKEAQDIFRGFSTAARALQLSTSDVDGIFRALGQIMSKGKLQAEELRQQLGDRLPGAFVRFATALDMTKPGQLDKALKDGAISGDKLKKAILSVAATMEVEFADSAKKMSLTVDAAFNRLKNAFTFTAADAGQNGLNAAIISITDALTKFIKSEGLNNFLKIVAKGFKLLGDNIELVANLLGGLAIYALLKWVTGLGLLARALGVVNTATKAFLSLRIAASLATTVGILGTLTTAFKVLGAVLMRHPIMWLAATIAAIVVAWNSFTGSTTAAKEAMDSFGGSTVTADNLITSYIDNIFNSTNALDINSDALRKNTIEKIRNAMINLGDVDLGIQGAGNLGPFTYKGYGTTPQAKAGRIAVGGTRINDQDAASLIGRLVTPEGKPTGVNTNADVVRLGQAVREAGAYIEMGGKYAEQLKTVIAPAKRQIELATKTSDLKGSQFYGVNEALGKAFGDFNREALPPGGITGDPLAKSKKGGGGKSEAEQAADRLERALQSAREAMSDLVVEANSADQAVSELLSGSMSSATATAAQAAASQLKTLEDALPDGEKVQATLALAKELQNAGKIGAEQNIATYDSAKKAVIEYMTVLQEAAARKRQDVNVGQDILKMKESNEIQQEANELLANSTTSQADYNRFLEVENALLGTSEENRAALRKSLTEEIEKRDQIARSLETTNRLRDLEAQKRINAELTPLMASGMAKEDLDYYREMFTIREDLIKQGYFGDQLRGRVAIEAAILNEARAMKILEDAYERQRQFAVDMADAIVGAFKEGQESGEDFLKVMKNIFKDLKSIVLDFVLYNPLKQFLSQVFQGGTTAGTPAMGSQVGYSTGGGSIGALISGGTGVLGALFQGGGGSTQTVTGAQRTLAHTMGASIGDAVREDGTIIVTGQRPGAVDTSAPIPLAQQSSMSEAFSNLKAIFAPNQGGKALKNLAAAVKSGKGISGAVGEVAGALGNAYAAYTIGNMIGKSVAKVLGGGSKMQNVAGGVLGGAAAGFALGGPIGAAIGAVAGGILGFMKKDKERQYAVAFGGVNVNANGVALPGVGGKSSVGSVTQGDLAAASGARLFNQFAIDIGGTLKAGNYGVFGTAAFSRPGEDEMSPFYSITGKMNGIHPAGVEGVDYIKGSESQTQAWAIIQQFKKGMITDISDVMKAVLGVTKAADMEQLKEDIEIGRAYEGFIKGSFGTNDVVDKIHDLNEAWKKLSSQAKILGLNETRLTEARDRMLKMMKDDFNRNVQQGILGYENPMLASYNDLVAEYKDTVEEAMAVGGDLAAVEKYYGLKRAEILKQTAEEANNGILGIAKDLLNQLTASNSSPLNAGTVLGNARDLFRGLKTEIAGGNYSNVDKLNTFATNYLDAARAVSGSSSGYFDIFNEVTEFLKTVSEVNAGTAGGTGSGADIPALPNIDDIVAEINAKNAEIVAATTNVGTAVTNVGAAVIEGSTEIVTEVNGIRQWLEERFGISTSSPSSGGTGATGVASTGTAGSGLVRTIGETANIV